MPTQTADDSKFKRELKAGWDDSAAGWKKWWPSFERAAQRVNDRLVALAEIAPGDRVLDLATGSGEPALTAARAVGPSGHVVAVDQSKGMLALARERIAAAGLTNVELVEADAEALSWEPKSFDAVLSRWGLMFMPDLDGVVHKIHHALKPDGCFATAVWATADKVPLIKLARDEIARITGQAPPPNAPDPTRLADTSILDRALVAAGFWDISIERMTVTFEFASAEAFADFRSDIGGTRAAMLVQNPDVRRQLREAIVAAARKFAAASGIVRLDNEAILVSAQA